LIEAYVRIAFLLQTFQDLPQIGRLVRALRTDVADDIVAISHSGPPQDHAQLAALPGVDHVSSFVGGRGNFNTVDGLIKTFRWLESQPTPYDWASILSGSDYPLRPIAALRAFLRSSPHDGYLYHFDVERQQAQSAPMVWPRQEWEDRYLFQYRQLTGTMTQRERFLLKGPRLLLERSRSYRLHTSYGLWLGARAHHHPFSDGFKLHGGNVWMTIRKPAVRAVLRFVDARPEIVEYFRRTIVPEEAFFPTIMANDPSLRLSDRELRYYDFRGSRHGRPRVFNESDLPELQASGCYIARKFDLNASPGLYARLDEIIGADSQPTAL
jgi:hypothetical protein